MKSSISSTQILAQVLRKLETALEGLVSYSEVYTDLSAAEDVRRYGRQLAEQLPWHCRREEVLLLDPAAEVSPELAKFCRQVKVEHAFLLAQAATFRAALDDFDRGEDLCAAIWRLKDLGKELMGALRQHVAREEEELSGFL